MVKDRNIFGPNRDALEGALEALAVGPEHAPLVEAARTLASVVDGDFDDKAWREYRLMLSILMGATAHNGSDAFSEWLAEMRTTVRDPENS